MHTNGIMDRSLFKWPYVRGIVEGLREDAVHGAMGTQ